MFNDIFALNTTINYINKTTSLAVYRLHEELWKKDILYQLWIKERLKGRSCFFLYNAVIIFHSSAMENISKEVENGMNESI